MNCSHIFWPAFGVRRQSGSGDGALGRARTPLRPMNFRPGESGGARRLPPQSILLFLDFSVAAEAVFGPTCDVLDVVSMTEELPGDLQLVNL